MTTVTIIIGLETHVQLLTLSKLFSRASTAFGHPPNTLTQAVDLGLPGTLPVMNRRALQLALTTATALNCEIPDVTVWDRKHYYYPDLPKGYQISQYDRPVGVDGYVDVDLPDTPASRAARKNLETLFPSGVRLVVDEEEDWLPARRVRILRAHLEEDAGKLTHDERHGRADSQVDLNRVGTPLLEIVTQPDLRTPAEAKAYLTELKLLLGYLNVSDCNMQEGSLRVDANVNLHIQDGDSVIATPIVEIKNMNSFRAVERALSYEVTRQYEQWRETGLTKADRPKQTRGWDDTAERTFAQRTKEESSDYRYFPDPDLVPMRVSAEQKEALRNRLGETPRQIRERLSSSYGVPAGDAEVLVAQGRSFVAYYEEVVQATDESRRAASWMQTEVLRAVNERAEPIDAIPVTPARLADLLTRLGRGEFDHGRAKDIFNRILATGEDVPTAVKALGITAVDESELDGLAAKLIADHPDVVTEVQAGNEKAIGVVLGAAKRANPNINPKRLREVVLAMIKSG